MLHSLSAWTETLRCRMRQRTVEREMMEVASRLPDEPESRCKYQRLLDEHLQLAGRATAHAGPRRQRA